MFKWIKELFKGWNDVQKELNEMGIFHANTHLGSWTHVDKEQFRKYCNDRHKSIPEDDRQTKV